jgi:uncharacterized protein (DUF1684 family)
MVSGAYAAALIGWREAVAEIYKTVRATHGQDAQAAWRRFRGERDTLYAHHPCSALSDAEKRGFSGFENFPYDPSLCFTARIDYEVEEKSLAASISEGLLPYRRIGRARFAYGGKPRSLSLFWLDIYGGGLWLPVGDETNGETSYGGGRYLYDTAKGANLGLSADGTSLLLDLNFLYPPSCALNAQWACPLCPPENRLPFRVEAGEMSRIFERKRAALRAV